MVTAGGASEFEGPPSESEDECAPRRCECLSCLRGVLWTLTGDAGDEGGEESCVGCQAKRAVFLIVAGGVVAAAWRCAFGDRSPLKEE